jgi:hypothetical protein
MANFTLETNRNTAITNIPRLTFQLPQSSNTPVPDTITPIYFCQTGCQLEFEFKNITTATLKNDGNYFTIKPNEDSNNYIKWNGSGVSGQNMTRFDLKEIKFSAPAKDVVGGITYNKSIQFYLTFVNSTYTNIMIVITIIGQANNVGNAQTDGYILLNSLAPQIPLRNDTKTVSNLENVNLGKLLPSNKSFFSTLLNNNNLQYISMTRIIDIPDTFLNNLISRLIGSQQSYESLVNKYTQQIPTNPQGTIIFYTENVNLINSDKEAYVCNANCDRVIGDATLLQPTIGTSKTTSTKSVTPTSISKSKIAGKNIPKQEECEEEYVFPGSKTNVNVKSDAGSLSNKNELTKKQTVSGIFQGIIIGLIVVLIIVFSWGIFYSLKMIANVKGMKFFSTIFWGDKENIPWIIITFIGFLGILICLIISIISLIEENSEKDKSDRKIKIEWWGLMLIGISSCILCIFILILKGFRNNISNIYKFQNLSRQIATDYSSNPDNFLKSKNNLLKASKIYKNSSPEQKKIINKSNPKLTSLLASNNKLLESMNTTSLSETNKKELVNLIQSFNKNPILVTPKIMDKYKSLITSQPDNTDLKAFEKNLKIGNPIPNGFMKYISDVDV